MTQAWYATEGEEGHRPRQADRLDPGQPEGVGLGGVGLGGVGLGGEGEGLEGKVEPMVPVLMLKYLRRFR